MKPQTKLAQLHMSPPLSLLFDHYALHLLSPQLNSFTPLASSSSESRVLNLILETRQFEAQKEGRTAAHVEIDCQGFVTAQGLYSRVFYELSCLTRTAWCGSAQLPSNVSSRNTRRPEPLQPHWQTPAPHRRSARLEEEKKEKGKGRTELKPRLEKIGKSSVTQHMAKHLVRGNAKRKILDDDSSDAVSEESSGVSSESECISLAGSSLGGQEEVKEEQEQDGTSDLKKWEGIEELRDLVKMAAGPPRGFSSLVSTMKHMLRFLLGAGGYSSVTLVLHSADCLEEMDPQALQAFCRPEETFFPAEDARLKGRFYVIFVSGLPFASTSWNPPVEINCPPKTLSEVSGEILSEILRQPGEKNSNAGSFARAYVDIFWPLMSADLDALAGPLLSKMLTIFDENEKQFFEEAQKEVDKIRELGGREGHEGSQEFLKFLSLSAKQLIVASFLAAHNPSSLDEKLFDVKQGRRRCGGQRRQHATFKRQKDNLKNIMCRQPQPFSLKRLLKIYSFMNDEVEPNLSVPVLEEVRSLLRMGLLSSVSKKVSWLEGSCRLASEVPMEVVGVVAKDINWKLEEYAVGM